MQKYLLAHRGYSEIAPENTKLAFDLAFDFGFDGVEIDLHLTNDNELVVIHDETVKRTSNGDGFVKDKSLKELQEFDYGCKFYTKVPFQKILTYEEFLKLYGNKFKFINTEIKTDIYHYKGIEKLIWEIDKKVEHKAKIIYSSFNFKSLEIMREISSELKLGFLFVDKKDVTPIEKDVIKICDYIHPWFKSLLNESELNYYKKLNLPINIWTIDKRNTEDIWTKNSYKIFQNLKDISLLNFIISNSKI